MNPARQAQARELLELHHADDILVLLNAWDVASARLFAAAGARAIGTTSMGIAASLGWPDQQQIPFDLMLEAIARIVEAVELPVSADLEAGYGDTTGAIVEAVDRAVAVGIVGLNLEDSTGRPDSPLIPPSQMAERIAAIRTSARSAGLHVVINARTDVFLAGVGAPSERLAATIERGRLYSEAGADCVFVPGGLEREVIRELVREIPAPINVVANPAISRPVVPSVAELRELGVARVSVGSGLMRAALGFSARAATEVLRSGTYDAIRDELERPGAPNSYEAAVGRRAALD